MKVPWFAFLFLTAIQLKAQLAPKEHHPYYVVAVSNSHTGKPFTSFSSLFYKEVHPGATLGYGKQLRNIRNHQWNLEITMNYMFHRWVQHNIGFSVNGGYRHSLGSSWGATVQLGGGYQLSIPTGKVFSITSAGLKNKGHVLRSQFITQLGLIADRKINSKGARVFMEYQQKLQAPFIKAYVPLLPYNNLLLGVSIPVHN